MTGKKCQTQLLKLIFSLRCIFGDCGKYLRTVAVQIRTQGDFVDIRTKS